MNYPPEMSRDERAARQRRAIAAYLSGMCSRKAAEHVGLSSGHVRDLIKLYGVSRPVGRPRNA